MKPYRYVLAFAVPLLALEGCAYQRSDEVTAQMARTEVVIQQADRSGVAVESLPQLQTAKDKYAKAKAELDRKSEEGDKNAVRLAKQAELDAQYASAHAQATKQENAAADSASGVQALRDEANRNADTPSPAAAPTPIKP
jgi:ATPase subunit of ABC transporter with duplicated ATPase domains